MSEEWRIEIRIPEFVPVLGIDLFNHNLILLTLTSNNDYFRSSSLILE